MPVDTIGAPETQRGQSEEIEARCGFIARCVFQNLILPLDCVAPAAASCQVGCQAEVTGCVLKTSWRNQTDDVLELEFNDVTSRSVCVVLTGQRRELESGAAHDLRGVNLNTVILVDRVTLRIFKTDIKPRLSIAAKESTLCL